MKYLLVLMALALAGCGGGSSDEAADDTVGAEIAEDMNDAMDKAAGVEGQIEDAKAQMDDAIDGAADDAEDAMNAAGEGVDNMMNDLEDAKKEVEDAIDD